LWKFQCRKKSGTIEAKNFKFDTEIIITRGTNEKMQKRIKEGREGVT